MHGGAECSACPWTQDAPQLAPQCNDAWTLWLDVQTQWRVGGFGVRTGLDMTAVRAVAEILEIELTPVTYRLLRGLELHMLSKSAAESKDEL